MNLTHHFLVSMPQMQDACFRNSVVYIIDHGDQGAFGVILNDALGMEFEALLSQVDISIVDDAVRDTIVLQGGPVDEGHGLVLHEPGPSFEATHDFSHGVSLSSSRDVLQAIAQGEEPATCLVILGHSGWAPGQLEMEVADNAWLTCQANNDILFRTPLHDRRKAVADLIGVDLASMVGQAGHA